MLLVFIYILIDKRIVFKEGYHIINRYTELTLNLKDSAIDSITKKMVYF